MNPSTHRSSWFIARDMFGFYAKWFAAVWLLLVAIISGIIVVAASIDEPAVSVFSYVLNPAPYWILVVGAVIPATLLRLYVANGVTRRDFVIGGGLALLGGCVLIAVLGTAALFVEGLVYSAAGWRHGFEGPRLFDSTDQLGLVFVELLLIFTSHMFAGWAAGAAFYRFGGWALPGAVVMYGLAVSVDIALGTSWAGRLVIDNVYTFDPSWMFAGAVGVVAVSVLVLLSWRLLRDIPVAAKRS